MNYKDFVALTICNLNPVHVEELKQVITGEYLSFSFIAENDITKEILAEKTCDYFEKLELKNGKLFDKFLEDYLKNLDFMIERRIPKKTQPKKNTSVPVTESRVRRYYEKAMEVKDSRTLSSKQLLEFSRIMFCLYASIINNDFKEIDNLDFSAGSINPKEIINAMKNEQDNVLGKIGKKKKFNLKELYCSDTATFIISILILCKLMNDRIQGDYYNE